MPPFAPPPGFARSVSAAPLSIQLSLQPMATFSTNVQGHKHKEKGVGGGQFTKNEGGSGTATDEPSARDRIPKGPTTRLGRVWNAIFRKVPVSSLSGKNLSSPLESKAVQAC